jgi:sec-independent protein translocase protein TatA
MGTVIMLLVTGLVYLAPLWHTGARDMGELFQPMHLLVILAVGVLLFGPKKIPELGKGLGEGIRGFKDAIKTATESVNNDVEKK